MLAARADPRILAKPSHGSSAALGASRRCPSSDAGGSTTLPEFHPLANAVHADRRRRVRRAGRRHRSERLAPADHALTARRRSSSTVGIAIARVSQLASSRYHDHYVGDDPLGFVMSMNVARRHLDDSRAMIAADIANMRQGERTDLAQPSDPRPKCLTSGSSKYAGGRRRAAWGTPRWSTSVARRS